MLDSKRLREAPLLAASRAIVMVLLLLAASPAVAQEHRHLHPEKLGSVHFATSCTTTAQNTFNQAVALLHSFQFSRAIAAFNATLAEDPACGIAYWGISLSDWSNPFAPGTKDRGQLQLGRENAARGIRVGAKTGRERAYMEAVGTLYGDFENTPQQARFLTYRDAMANVAAAFPDDSEAQIFYALALAAAEDPEDKTYAGRLKAGAILEGLFAHAPTHPGLAHYLIHTYDVPALADQALAAARRYAAIAPDAPHALHMPSHTFTRLGYWQESIDSNVAAAASARRQGQTAEELHARDYEVYAYLQTGQDRAAERITRYLPELAARFDPTAVIDGAGGPSVGYFALAAIPARDVLERGQWVKAEHLPLRKTPFPYTDAMTWFARGLGAARVGHSATASEAAARLQQIQRRLVTDEPYWARQVQIQQLAVSAWTSLAAGDPRHALLQMESAADLEDGTEKSAVTPGPLAPARELLGEMLLKLHEPAQALDQFAATLQREPRRFRSLYGAAYAAQASGNRAASEQYYRELLQVWARADRPGRRERVMRILDRGGAK